MPTIGPKIWKMAALIAAVGAVVANARLGPAPTAEGSTLGAPMPWDGNWSISNVGGLGGAYAYYCTNSAATPLPMPVPPALAGRIEWKSDMMGAQFTCPLGLFNPVSKVQAGVNFTQLGYAATNFTGGIVYQGAWLRLDWNVSQGGVLTWWYSIWGTGKTPDTHQPDHTITGTVSGINQEDGLIPAFIAPTGGGTSRVYDVSIYSATPDALPAGILNLATLQAQGYTAQSRSNFPIVGADNVSGSFSSHKIHSMQSAGTHICITFLGIYGRTATNCNADYTVRASVRKIGGAPTQFILSGNPTISVIRGDVTSVILPYVHDAENLDIITYVTTTNGFPADSYFADDGCNAAYGTGLTGADLTMAANPTWGQYMNQSGTPVCFTYIVTSLTVDPAVRVKSFVAATDSRGVFCFPEKLASMGRGVLNLCIGGMTMRDLTGASGYLQRALLGFGRNVALMYGANDLREGTTSAQLADRSDAVLDLCAQKGLRVFRDTGMPVCSTTQDGAGVAGAVGTQPRYLNSVGSDGYRFQRLLQEPAPGVIQIPTHSTVADLRLFEWIPGMDNDRLHLATVAGNNAIKATMQTVLAPIFAADDAGEVGGLTSEEAAQLQAIETRVTLALPNASFDSDGGLAPKSWHATMFSAVGTAISNLLSNINLVKGVTDKLNTMLQASGLNWQFTPDSLESTPQSSQAAVILRYGPFGLTPADSGLDGVVTLFPGDISAVRLQMTDAAKQPVPVGSATLTATLTDATGEPVGDAPDVNVLLNAEGDIEVVTTAPEALGSYYLRVLRDAGASDKHTFGPLHIRVRAS